MFDRRFIPENSDFLIVNPKGRHAWCWETSYLNYVRQISVRGLPVFAPGTNVFALSRGRTRPGNKRHWLVVAHLDSELDALRLRWLVLAE